MYTRAMVQRKPKIHALKRLDCEPKISLKKKLALTSEEKPMAFYQAKPTTISRFYISLPKVGGK